MKILVPVKRVPDPYGQIRLTEGGELDETDLKWVINPFDEIALEEAVRIRERGIDVEIVAVTVGGGDCEPTLRNALAMGADRAILVEDAEECDSDAVTTYLQAVAKLEKPDLILMGKQAVDDDNSQVGPRLAAALAMPQATFASEIVLSDGAARARVTREVDSGQETIDVSLPAVVTTDLRLNEPRYVALPAIIKARAKTIHRMPGVEVAQKRAVRLRTVRRELPPSRKAGRLVASVPELVAALRDEARVL
jgi:electron transfer flavoprotein beta subunit